MLEHSESSNPDTKQDVYSLGLVKEGWALSGHGSASERMMMFSLAELPDIFAYVAVISRLVITGKSEPIREADSIVRRIPSKVVLEKLMTSFSYKNL